MQQSGYGNLEIYPAILYLLSWHDVAHISYFFTLAPDSKVHGAHLGTVGPRWAPCGPHELCSQERVAKSIHFVVNRKFATGKPLESLLHRCFTDMTHCISKENGYPFDPLPKSTLMVYNIIASMAFGKTWVCYHYDDVIMGAMASQITSLTIVYLIVYLGTEQRKHQSSASLAFVWGIHRGPVNSPHKWPVTRKMSPFDDVINHTRSWQYNKWQRWKTSAMIS